MTLRKEAYTCRWFVSRHPGAKAWMAAQKLKIDQWVEHLDLTCICEGDEVYGTLSVPLAAEAIKRGARYFHLTLDMTVEARGTELSAEEMDAHGARFEEFMVRKLP